MDSLKIIKKEADLFVSEGKKINIINTHAADTGDFKGKIVSVNGLEKIDLTRLDYLALGSSDEIKNIMMESIKKYDLSCPASQMVMKSEPTIRLERTLADFHGMKGSILFTSGYSVNDNILQALGSRLNTHYVKHYISHYFAENNIKAEQMLTPTIFFIDSESHYSLHHGAQIAKHFIDKYCMVEKFSCMNYKELKEKIEKANKDFGENTVKIIVSDALSSISGRIFDIDILGSIAEEYECLLYIDEAHSTGVLGPQGRGVAAGSKGYEKYKNRMLVMGTLTKAFSQSGGYITVPDENLEIYLRSCSPQYIFSAPILPWMADTLVKTIELIKGEFGEKRRKDLLRTAAHMRDKLEENNFNILGSNSQIIPVLIKDEEKAEKVKEFFNENGFIVSLFRYPAVPKGFALIRFSLCADITKKEVDRVVELLLQIRKKLGF